MASRFFAAFRKIVSPKAFASWCLVIGALWFLIGFPALEVFTPKALPPYRSYPEDAGQLYMAAVAARYGLWDDLYPNYRESDLLFPPRHTPRSALLTGTPENPRGTVEGFIRLSRPWHSVVPTALEEKAPHMREVFSLRVCRFIQPPPFALLLTPVAYMDVRTLGFIYLPLFSSFALFGMAFFSARIYRELAGASSYLEGVIVLIVMAFSMTGYTHIDEGNTTPFLGFLIALAAYGWLRGWQVVVGISTILLILAKSVGLNWCPLLVLRNIRWRTLATMAGLTVLLNGATLALGGWPAYQRFFHDILPSVDSPAGQGIPGMVWEQLGVYPATLYRIMIILGSGIIYWGFRQRAEERQAPVILAALAGTMAVFCSLNSTVWLPYLPSYLFLPFLGWIFWECGQAQGKWRVALIAGTVICLTFVLYLWFIWRINSVIVQTLPLPFNGYGIVAPFYGFVAPAFILLIAFRRLFHCCDSPAESKPSRSFAPSCEFSR